MDKANILLIEDEKEMRSLLRTFLEKDGYTVFEAVDAMHAFEILDTVTPDLMLVDVMMPYLNGFDFAAEVKRVKNIPLIFVSARGEEWDKIKGLKLGGDDYIVKPFHPGELLARIESVLRRTKSLNVENEVFTSGPLSFQLSSYSAELERKPLSLTLKEFELLLYLARNKGRVFTREQLLHNIWGDDYQGTERTVDTHVKTLRLKLKQHSSMIATVWGIGYKFEAGT
ncbi:response regulator [Bacillus lacus]|uniref:Response regulator n=2 Tax=Metabacillus lacus TaxID=1983721 RepID=A0A7X2IZ85_9BACI|nr:response regulator transcription factor [Metabacillus lacus]MRX71878.1 response regulator [Metabacillus lacus]